MNKDDENDALWELLGRARRIEASPFFARKVVFEIRRQEQRPRLSLKRLLHWFIPTAACAGVLLGWLAYQHQQDDSFDSDFDRVADLQSLVVPDDNLAWLDDPALLN